MEIFAFLRLYTDMADESSLLWMPLFWGLFFLNSGIYIADLYRVVKKKTLEETVIVMLVPVSLVLTAVMLITMEVYIPADAALERFADMLDQSGLAVQLLGAVLLCAGIWGVTWLILRGRCRDKKERRKWFLSCIPDYVTAAAAAFVCVYRLVSGENLLRLLGGVAKQAGFTFNIFLYVFLYLLLLLFSKAALLVLGAFVCLYAARITCFRWRETKDPVWFFIRYAAFYQNAFLRGILVFVIPLLVLITMAVTDHGGLDMGIAASLYLCAAVSVFVCLYPTVRAVNLFGRWGNRRKLMELFCREYFLEPPVAKGEDYTVTRHFLVDERRAATVFYWQELKEYSRGWSSDKRGWVRHIWFYDGRACTVLKGEDPAEQVMQCAKTYWEAHMLQAGDPVKEEKEKRQEREEAEKFRRIWQPVAIGVFVVLAFFWQTWKRPAGNTGDDAGGRTQDAQAQGGSGRDGAESGKADGDAGDTGSQEDDIFPLLAASNEFFDVYAESCETVVTGQYTYESGGKVYIVNQEGDKFGISVRDKSGRQVQHLEEVAEVLHRERTVLSGEGGDPIARFEDMNFDGYEDLLLLCDNRYTGYENFGAWDVFLWDPEAGQFTAGDEVFRTLYGTLADPQERLVWGARSIPDGYSIETYVYTAAQVYQPYKVLQIIEYADVGCRYVEISYADGTELQRTEEMLREETDSFWDTYDWWFLEERADGGEDDGSV